MSKQSNAKQQSSQSLKKLLSLINSPESHAIGTKDLNSIFHASSSAKFPVYATILLLKAKNTRKERIPLKTKEGWINISYEKQISDLKREIQNLKKSKLIVLPTFDTKWKNAFRYTFIGLGVVLIFLIFNVVQYYNKSEELTVEKSQSQKKTEIINEQQDAIEETKTDLGNQLDTQERSLDYYRTENQRLRDQITTFNNRISRLNRELLQVRNTLATASPNTTQSNSRIRELEREIRSLKNNIEIYKSQVQRLNRIGYNTGMDIKKISSCNTQFCKASQIKFDAINPVKVQRIQVKARKEGSGVFTLYNSINVVVEKKTVQLSKGTQTVYLNFFAPKGDNYTIAYEGVKIQAIKECYQLPYTVRNLISLKQVRNNQYTFFNWRVYANI